MGSGPQYFRVSPKFWRDARDWDDRLRVIALYLLTNEHRTTEGFYYLPLGYVQTDLGYTQKTIEPLWAFLQKDGFMLYDDDAQVVLVRSALKYQAPATDAQKTGAINRLATVPPTWLWSAFRVACELHCPSLWSAIEERMPVALEYSSSTSFSSSSTESGGSDETGERERFDAGRERLREQAASAATHPVIAGARGGAA